VCDYKQYEILAAVFHVLRRYARIENQELNLSGNIVGENTRQGT